MVPAAMELIDKPAIGALERAFSVGYPPNAGAVLLMDVDGLHESVEEQTELVSLICQGNRASQRVAEKVGLRLVRSLVRHGGGYHLYACSRDEGE